MATTGRNCVIFGGSFWFWLLAGFLPVPSPGAGVESAAIVYSARYYKPGKEGSRYHLWRIQPDGSGRVQVTADSKAADHSPLWLADGHTILFMREEGGTNRFCTVAEGGGAVTTIARTPGAETFLRSVSPDRRSLVFLVTGTTPQLHLLDVASKSFRALGAGWDAEFSPDGQKLYCSGQAGGKSGVILNLMGGKKVALRDGLRAGTWVDDDLLVAEQFVEAPGQPRLCLIRAIGTVEREIPIAFNWNDELSPFADDLFRIPGDRESVLYGRHAGDSTGGAAHQFYRVNLTTGKTALLVDGRDVAWSPDHRFFCTGDRRDLAPLPDKREVWVSPLHIVSLEDGSRQTLVQGLVSVGGFDWRPAAPVEKPARK